MASNPGHGICPHCGHVLGSCLCRDCPACEMYAETLASLLDEEILRREYPEGWLRGSAHG